MLYVSQLFVYPVKSLGGVALTSARVTDRGFQYDRRWMLVDHNNLFLSQREFAAMALLKVSIKTDGLLVKQVTTGRQITIPFIPQSIETGKFIIWDDTCTGWYVSPKADRWFSEVLNTVCRLVYMPDDSRRIVDAKYVPEERITSFADAYPYLMIGQASLDDLNNRLEQKIPVNRFRPNIVFTGGAPYLEDTMAGFKIGRVYFKGVKFCARCNVPTIDQDTAIKANEPIYTLARYRRNNHKVYLGQNLVHSGEGAISIGDSIEVLEVKEMLNSLTITANA